MNAYSVRMRRLSLLATLMVVFLHSYWMDISEAKDGSLEWWVQDIVSQGLCRSAVPYFFIVFAFWLFKDFGQIDGCRSILAWWSRNVVTRFKTVALPYVLWSLVSACIFFVLYRITHGQSLMPELLDWGWWGRTLGVIDYPKYAFHLWFLKALVYYVVLSPMIGIAVRYLGIAVLIGSFVFGLFFPNVPYWLSNGLFFVCMGCYISGLGDRIVSDCRKHVAVLLVILWCVLVVVKVWATKQGMCDIYGIFHIDGMPVNIMMLINAVGIFALWQIGRTSALEHFDGVAMSAFFIYCMHRLVGSFVLMIMMKIPIVCGYRLVLWAVTPLLAFVISMVIWHVCRVRLPMVYRILSGGR